MLESPALAEPFELFGFLALFVVSQALFAHFALLRLSRGDAAGILCLSAFLHMSALLFVVASFLLDLQVILIVVTVKRFTGQRFLYGTAGLIAVGAVIEFAHAKVRLELTKASGNGGLLLQHQSEFPYPR